MERLPTNIKPVSYNINLVPDLDNFTFDGLININLKVIESTNSFVFHCKDLKIKKTVLIFNNDKYICENISFDKEKEIVIFTFDQVFNPDNYDLKIKYTGIINNELNGFYRSEYEKSKMMTSTQFQPFYARKVIPCIDEPVIKAVFKLSLTIPNNLVALSNCQIIDTVINSDNTKTVIFAETPIMSTYLLAFVIGPLDYVETYAKLNSNKKIKVRTYCPVLNGSSYSKYGKFSNNLAAKTIEFLSEFFDQDYPLEKLDMVALPDFSAGAMENWGLITYRTQLILYDPEITSDKMKMSIALTVCHEVAHQWFGNLVTMEWWSDIWLNEGFATWIEYMVIDHFYPELNAWNNFYLDEFLKGLSLDSLNTSHPIKSSIENSEQIYEFFDAISYSKGACLIKMIVEYIGLNMFRDCLRDYFKKFKYSNAQTEDLLECLENISDKPIIDLMNSWTSQMNFPLLTIKENKNKGMYITQSNFNKDNHTKQVWKIPLNILKLDEGKKELYIINNNQTSFYRTIYDDVILTKFAPLILNKKLSPLNRAGIIDNLFISAKFNYLNINKPLEYLVNYHNETEHVVIAIIIKHVNEIKSIYYKYPDILKKISDKLSILLFRWIKKVKKISNKSYEICQLQILLINEFVNLGNVEFVNQCLNMYKYGDLKPNLRKTVYMTVTKYGDINTYKNMLNLLKSDKSIVSDNINILQSLGNFEDIDLIEKTLDMILDKNSIVRTQDIYIVIGSCIYNFKSRDFTIKYIMDNWSKLINKINSKLLGKVVTSCIKYCSLEQDIKIIRDFLKLHKKDTKSIETVIMQSFERSKINVNYLKNTINELSK
jgi:aminopeptidase N